MNAAGPTAAAAHNEPASPNFAVVGAQLPTRVALREVRPVPADIIATVPEMRGVGYVKVAADKLVLIDSDTRVVIGVIPE